MATQMSAYASLDGKQARIRVALCEPDAAVRAQLRDVIERDPLLVIAGESESWAECAACLDDWLPELLMARSELIPADWPSHDSFQPVVIALHTTLMFPGPDRLSDELRIPADSRTIRASLERAVREIYDRKAKQLLFLVERYVAGSRSISPYKLMLQVERDGELFELRSDNVLSVVAARKQVSIHSTEGRFLLREPIHQLAERLDPAVFVRIHRSVIVNLRHVKHSVPATTKPSFVVMSDGSRYPVGPNHRQSVEAVLRDSL